MPDERNYYVLCDDNCRFESMTKEQIIAAIAEATGATPTHIDDAFITKIKETNANEALKFWIGTSAEYNALVEGGRLVNGVLYILTDETWGDDIQASVEALQGTVDNVVSNVQEIRSSVETLQESIQDEKILRDTGWQDWISNGVTVGRYRIIGKTIYYKFQNFDWRSFGDHNVDIPYPLGVDFPNSYFAPMFIAFSYNGVTANRIDLYYATTSLGNGYFGIVGSQLPASGYTVYGLIAAPVADDVEI